MKVKILVLIVILLSLGLKSLSVEPKDREDFLKLVEIMKLIQAAKEAGFSDQELQNMTLKDEYKKSIEVSHLIEMVKEMEKHGLQDRSIRELKINPEEKHVNALQLLLDKLKSLEKTKEISGNYLTIGEIFKELAQVEPETLSKFRDQVDQRIQ